MTLSTLANDTVRPLYKVLGPTVQMKNLYCIILVVFLHFHWSYGFVVYFYLNAEQQHSLDVKLYHRGGQLPSQFLKNDVLVCGENLEGECSGLRNANGGSILKVYTGDCFFDRIDVNVSIPEFEAKDVIIRDNNQEKILWKSIFQTEHHQKEKNNAKSGNFFSLDVGASLLPYTTKHNIKRVIFPKGGTVLVNFNNVIGTPCFWCLVEQGLWEPVTFQVFREHIKSTTLVLDIGSWIGPTSLFAANLAHTVVAFEPDHIAYNQLRSNVDLNPHLNIHTLNKCVSNKHEFITMNSRELGNSMSMVSRNFENTNIIDISNMNEASEVLNENKIMCLSFNDAVKQLVSFSNITLSSTSKADQHFFVKIDTEGDERYIFPAMKEWIIQTKPVVFVSMHQFLVTFTTLELIAMVETFKQCGHLVEILDNDNNSDQRRTMIPVDTSTLLPELLCIGCDYLCTF